MFSTVATNRASTGGVAWINQNHRDTRTPCLVGHKLFQLIETPVAKLKTHLSAEAVSSLSDTAKVFKNECLPEPSRSFDKSAADVMVHPASEACLATAQPLKVTLCRFRTALLKPSAKPSQGASDFANRFSAVLVSFAVRRNLHNAKVNTNRAVDFAKRGIFDVAGCHQVERTIQKNEVRFTTQSLEQFGLVFTANEGDSLSSCESPDRNAPLLKDVSEDSGIVGDGSQRTKSANPLSVPFVSVRDFSKEECDYLRGESCFVAYGFVPLVVQVKTPKYLGRKRPIRHAASRLIGFHHCLFEEFCLLLCGQEFDLCNELHRQHSIIIMTNNQERTRIAPKPSGRQE